MDHGSRTSQASVSSHGVLGVWSVGLTADGVDCVPADRTTSTRPRGHASQIRVTSRGNRVDTRMPSSWLPYWSDGWGGATDECSIITREGKRASCDRTGQRETVASLSLSFLSPACQAVRARCVRSGLPARRSIGRRCRPRGVRADRGRRSPRRGNGRIARQGSKPIGDTSL